jgi:hypothetical protein
MHQRWLRIAFDDKGFWLPLQESTGWPAQTGTGRQVWVVWGLYEQVFSWLGAIGEWV